MFRPLCAVILIFSASSAAFAHPGHAERGWIAAFVYHVLADHFLELTAAGLCAAGMLLLVRRWRKGSAR